MSITAYNETYHDDINTPDVNGKTPIDKNYLRVLFKPGVAVQTRELNQLQSSIQAQLDQMGQSLFASGSRVLGGEVNYEKSVQFIDCLIDSSDTFFSSDTDLNIVVESNIGTDTLSASVIKYDIISADSAYKTVRCFIKYITASSSGGTNTQSYVTGNNVTLSKVGSTSEVLADITNVGFGACATIQKGVYFVNGCYAVVDKQIVSIVPPTGTSTYNGFVVLDVIESKVNSDDDSTLLDNSNGTPNYAASGADRYSLNLVLNILDVIPNGSNVITLLSIVNGAVLVKNDNPSELTNTLAQRTYEESGNYIVNPFPIDIRESYNDGTNGGLYTTSDLPLVGYSDGDGTPDINAAKNDFIAKLDPSVAYVKGYRIASRDSIPLKVNKARDTYLSAVTGSLSDEYKEVAISASMGNYIDVTFAAGSRIPSIDDTTELYTLKDSSNANVATFKVKSIENIGDGRYRIFCYDIEVIDTKLFSDGVAITSPGGAVFDVASIPLILGDTNVTDSIYTLPVSPVKSVRKVRYQQKRIFNVDVLTGSVTITIPEADGQFDKSNTSIIVGSSSGGILTFNITQGTDPNILVLTGLESVTNVDIIATVYTDAILGNKTLKTETRTLTAVSGTDGLYIVDGVKHLVSVNDTRFEIDHDGQNGSNYTTAKIKTKSGVAALPATCNCTFFEFSSGGIVADYFSVDSYYAADGSKLSYEQIPTYNGQPLYDVLDFRNYSTSVYPIDPYGVIEMEVDYYLGRIDNVCVNSSGDFYVSRGIPNENPLAPIVSDDSMCLYQLEVAPYTFSMDDVNVIKVDNNRYTMRDIGKLETRIHNLEYYTTLSLLEKSAADQSIFDTTDDRERYKNGFVADNFLGHGVGDPTNPDYMCSVDPERGILRPYFKTSSLKFGKTNVSSISGSGGTASGVHDKAITLDYTVIPYISQLLSSESMSVNPYNIVSYIGTVKLFPAVDHWVETQYRPQLIIKDDSAFDAMRSLYKDLGVLGTEWNSWKTYDVGISSEVLSTTFSRRSGVRGARSQRTTVTEITDSLSQARQGIKTSIGRGKPNIKNLGDRIVDITVRPYIRSRYVYFEGQTLKPNTTFTPFFDDVNVSEHVYNQENLIKENNVTFNNVTPTDVPVATLKDSTNKHLLKSDSRGRVRGVFVIPNPNTSPLKFLTGSRTFRLIDNQTNNLTESETHADGTYTASGVLETKQNSILSTAVPELVRTRVTDKRVVTKKKTVTTTAWIDPLAQSFLITNPEGVYLTGVDLYFEKKPTEADAAPVEIYIVPTETGLPTQTVVPFTNVTVDVEDVEISDTATVPTRFTFDQPVYLLPGVEYALVCLSNSNEYFAYVAEKGKTDISTGRKIDKNPYAGSFFTSQNSSTWTPDQSRDMKFVLHRAKFSVGEKAVQFQTNIQSSLQSIDITNGGSGYTLPPTVTITGGGAILNATARATVVGGIVTKITLDEIDGVIGGGGYTSAPTVTLSAPPAGFGNVTATAVSILPSYPVSTFLLKQNAVTIDIDDNTQVIKSADVKNKLRVLGKEYQVIAKESYDSTRAKQAWDGNGINRNDLVTLETILTTDSDYLSPAIDTESLSLTVVENFITNDEDTSSAYITRDINLKNPADRIDIYLDVNRPTRGTSLNVYVKTKNTLGESGDWIKVNPFSPTILPVDSDTLKYSEVHYIYNSDTEFISFAVKMTLTSDNIVDVPTVANFRAIATS